jgi:hypothetical protein
VAGLVAVTDAAAEAKRLACAHWLKDTEIVAIP